MPNLKSHVLAAVCTLGIATPMQAQNNNMSDLLGPDKEYFECVLACEAKFGGCFQSRQSTLSDPRQLLDKVQRAKLQAKEIQSVYLCFRAKSDCHAKCAAPFGRD